MDQKFQLNPAPSPKAYKMSAKRRSLKNKNSTTMNNHQNLHSSNENLTVNDFKLLIEEHRSGILKKIKRIPITDMYIEIAAEPYEPITRTFQYQHKTLVKMARNDWNYLVKRFIVDTPLQRERALQEITLHVIAAKYSNKIIEPRRIFENKCDDGHLYLLLVMEYCPEGTLFTKLHQIFQQGQRFKTYKIKKFIRQIAEALSTLHTTLNVAHRDVKPENILLGPNNTLFLADFGFAKPVNLPDKLTTPVYSKSYTPPEIIRQISGENVMYDQKCDIWSLGVILYVFYTGKFPFHTSSKEINGDPNFQDLPQDLRNKIVAGEIDWNENDFLGENVWKDEASAKDLVQKMLTVDPEERIGIQEVLEHEYFKVGEVIQ